MLQLPAFATRTNMIRFMIELYDPKTETFVVQDKAGAITATSVDIECIYGLRNEGYSAFDIIDQECLISRTKIPASYLSKSSGNLVISDLIADIQREKASDDDFVRKAVLVLIGTVLAPSGPKTVDRDHYCLVEDVPRIFKINWNHFTLRYLLDNLSAYTRSAAKGRGWPVGNLCLTQVCKHD
jgi:hypothetical protein